MISPAGSHPCEQTVTAGEESEEADAEELADVEPTFEGVLSELHPTSATPIRAAQVTT